MASSASAVKTAVQGVHGTRSRPRLGWLVLALAVSISTFRPAQAQIPTEIQSFTQENAAICRLAGGTPMPSSSYLTETDDLNGDGKPDYVTNLAALECVNAWSVFCGSAGCPVTVWLSNPAGYSVGWGGSAQDWKLRGKEIVVALHGQFCTPPRIGADSCEVVMRFDQPARRKQSAAPPSAPLRRGGCAR